MVLDFGQDITLRLSTTAEQVRQILAYGIIAFPDIGSVKLTPDSNEMDRLSTTVQVSREKEIWSGMTSNAAKHLTS